VLKIAKVVSNLDSDITLIGRKSDNCCEKTILPFKVRRFRMLFRRGFLFYKFFNIRLFFFLLFHKYDVLVANDLDTLLPNYLVSKLKRIPLVYDSHEFFTGVPEIQNRPLVRWVWTAIEKSIFPHLKYVMTVSDSISDQYFRLYGIRPVTVRNCTPSVAHLSGYSRKELCIPAENLLLIFQGAGINVERGGVELIEAVSKIDRVTLLIIGSGDIIPDLKERVNKLNISDKIKFLPRMPWEELMRYTKSADAGVSLDKDNNPNYRFSLPNKLFDYLSAGIPVIAGPLPEVEKIIRQWVAGIILMKVTPEEIRQAIICLRDNPDVLNKLKANAVIASGNITWEKESMKVVELYKNILE
jgi:glycosyltransferase involved in cell wall biosynthesis